MSEEKKKLVKFTTIGIVLAIVLLCTLIYMSFADLEYYELGFLKRKSSSAVNTDKVYTTGHHLVGPDYTFKIFKADAHLEQKSDVAIFTSDRLEVWITCTFQYYIRPEQLPKLHEKFDIYYEDIVSSNALDALKVAATSYSTDEFITSRSIVETALFKAVRERLGGTCCELNCQEDDSCIPGCTPESDCQDADRGLFVHVAYFQMQEVTIPSDVAERYLQALLLQEQTERAEFEQTAAVVERRTEAMVQAIHNEAAEIAQNATAHSDLILTWADANATAIIETARSRGLKDLYDRLGLDQEEYRGSFDYLRTIKNMDNAHLSIEFDNLITGPVNGQL